MILIELSKNRQQNNIEWRIRTSSQKSCTKTYWSLYSQLGGWGQKQNVWSYINSIFQLNFRTVFCAEFFIWRETISSRSRLQIRLIRLEWKTTNHLILMKDQILEQVSKTNPDRMLIKRQSRTFWTYRGWPFRWKQFPIRCDNKLLMSHYKWLGSMCKKSWCLCVCGTSVVTCNTKPKTRIRFDRWI